MDYQEFRQMYEDQHPASVPQPEIYIAEYPKWVIPVVGCMFVAAALFSGVHTVPLAYDAIDKNKVAEWIRQIAGVSAFVFVETGVLVSAYLIVKRFTWVMFAILLITITVAMGANLYSVYQALESINTDGFTTIITILFGLVAPLMAALSGGVYVWLHQSQRMADARSQAKLKAQQIEWDSIIEHEWKKYQRTDGRKGNRPQSSDLSASNVRTDGQADNSGQNTGQGYTKRTDARAIVKSFLEANPDAITGNVRQIAEQLEVGKTTVSDVQREMKEHLAISTNGHH